MDDIHKNISEYNSNKKREISWLLICLVIRKLIQTVTELFIRGRKLNISLNFIAKSNFTVPKHYRLNSTHYIIMKTPNKRELQKIVFNHSSDTDF